jgi:hypothetical protein
MKEISVLNKKESQPDLLWLQSSTSNVGEPIPGRGTPADAPEAMSKGQGAFCGDSSLWDFQDRKS